MAWWHYLLLVNLYLLLFFGFYALLLRNETFFQLNRCYLVAGALLSFLIPVIQAKWVTNLFITRQVQHTLYATLTTRFIYPTKPIIQHTTLNIGQVLMVVYIGVAVVLLLRLFYQLLSVKKLFNKTDVPVPFSFFKYIKTDNGQPRTIFEHEQVHANQWHSVDILLIEAVMIVNWFNPVVYFYRKAIKHVHEFIADKKAIEKGTPKAEYAYLLLSQTFGVDAHRLTSNFFSKGLLKQRIMMLNKDESQHRMLLKYGLSVPLFVGMLILSAATVKNSEVIKTINNQTEQLLSTNTLSLPLQDQPKKTIPITNHDRPNLAANIVIDSVATVNNQANDTLKAQSAAAVDISLNRDNQVADTVKNTSNLGNDTREKNIVADSNTPVKPTDEHYIQGEKFFYFVGKSGSRDSLKIVYMINGAEITAEQASTYPESQLKAINIIGDYTNHTHKMSAMMLILKDNQ